MPAIERPTTDRLIEILRQNDEAGDILCGHAADEIERLRTERQQLCRAASEMRADLETARNVHKCNSGIGPRVN